MAESVFVRGAAWERVRLLRRWLKVHDTMLRSSSHAPPHVKAAMGPHGRARGAPIDEDIAETPPSQKPGPQARADATAEPKIAVPWWLQCFGVQLDQDAARTISPYAVARVR